MAARSQAELNKILRNQPRTNTPLLVRQRSPEEVKAEHDAQANAYAYIDHAIDFLYEFSKRGI